MQQELLGIINHKISSTKIDSSELGFFSLPIIVNEGKLANKIVKVYAASKSKQACDYLADKHQLYIQRLTGLGVLVPETRLEIVSEKNRKHYLVVIQQAFQTSELVRGMIERAEINQALTVMFGVLDDVLKFIRRAREQNVTDTVGFHPTLRNYALCDGKYYFFDTFPPMAVEQKELNKILLEFIPFPIPKFIRYLARMWIHIVTDEYYQYDKMILGVIGSVCRLKPESAEIIMEASRKYISEQILERQLRDSILLQLSKPPRLKPIWILFRKLFGKKGAPNI